MRRTPPLSRFAMLVGVVLLAGCNAFGPRAVQGTRVAYNEVLARTQDEQLLLNIIRLRYVDVPMFLEVSSVNTQFEFRTTADASISGIFGNSFSEHEGEIGAGFSVIEKPTVTYVPLQGDAFVKQMMMPLDLDTIILMTRGGWSSHRVLRVCAQTLCGLPNAPSAAGPALDIHPKFERFQRAVQLLRQQQRARVGYIAHDGDEGYVLHVAPADPATLELRELLGLPEGDAFPVRAGSRRVPGVVTIGTRSMLSALFYLSQGIDVPPPHAKKGWATPTSDVAWRAAMTELFRVRSSRAHPTEASVAVRYRDWWFYIDDADISSKATFAMVSYLFAVQSGDRSSRGPALTIGL